ncbi:hypothetical protein A2159_01765 [Candidatus Woesebacteria bacterium RBG_13_34_9]|uniref:Uncharacterized protein n=1 Tax=Candidatus Woesebacteria bacterium RBG_13_34_9 TaxID=1802477 RepID=A0A1F7X242_9BACT|nr:MAG: hypothetical protein A2159_01765 [Candidatus Woesebacteria bacterium RBG_13_34_9]
MKELLQFIIKEIIEESDFSIEETDEENTTRLRIVAQNKDLGLIIGKNGVTIKSIQNILRVKGRLEGKLVFVDVAESSN